MRSNTDKVWVRLENGPGEVIGQGGVKPKGEPEAVVNVPLTTWEARRLAFAVLAHLDAWVVITFKQRTSGSGATPRSSTQHEESESKVMTWGAWSLEAQKAHREAAIRDTSWWPRLARTQTKAIIERPLRGNQRAFAEYIKQRLPEFRFDFKHNWWEAELVKLPVAFAALKPVRLSQGAKTYLQKAEGDDQRGRLPSSKPVFVPRQVVEALKGAEKAEGG